MKHLLILCNCFSPTSCLKKGCPARKMCLNKIWIHANRGLNALNAFGLVPGLAENHPEIIAGFRKIGLTLQGVLVMLNCLGRPCCLAQRVCKIEMPIRIFGL